MMNIRKYNESKDYNKIILLFKSEKDWSCYLGNNSDVKYKESLKKSITYVAYYNKEIIGYSRSIEDFGFYIYVCDLLVHRKFRGKYLGKKLMECLLDDYPDYEIFVMSDVDQYYKKLGYDIEGSIFKVSGS